MHFFQVRNKVQMKNVTYFFLFPQVDFHAIDRHHDVDFFLLDVFHLELILQREDKQGRINILVDWHCWSLSSIQRWVSPFEESYLDITELQDSIGIPNEMFNTQLHGGSNEVATVLNKESATSILTRSMLNVIIIFSRRPGTMSVPICVQPVRLWSYLLHSIPELIINYFFSTENVFPKIGQMSEMSCMLS